MGDWGILVMGNLGLANYYIKELWECGIGEVGKLVNRMIKPKICLKYKSNMYLKVLNDGTGLQMVYKFLDLTRNTQKLQ